MTHKTDEEIEETREATKMLVSKAWRKEESVTTVKNKINLLWEDTLSQVRKEAYKKGYADGSIAEINKQNNE